MALSRAAEALMRVDRVCTKPVEISGLKPAQPETSRRKFSTKYSAASKELRTRGWVTGQGWVRTALNIHGDHGLVVEREAR